MRRKFLSLFLAFAMAVSLVSTTFAHNPTIPSVPVTMAGDSNTMAIIDEDNHLWVHNFSYESSLFANGMYRSFGNDTPVLLDTDVASVSVCYTHIAYIKTDGSLWIQGNNKHGAAGTGQRLTILDEPTKIMENVIAVSVSDNATAVIRSDHSLWVWGNLPGQTPFGCSLQGEFVPHKVADDVIAVSLVSNANASIPTDYGLFLKEDGTLWGWGSNVSHILSPDFYGMLNGTDYPVKLMSNVSSFAAGDAQCAAVTKNGDLYVWGSNYFGCLGFDWNPSNREGEYQLTPKKVLSDVSKVVIGSGNGCTVYALKKDGSLWGAGDCAAGQLGKAYTDLYAPDGTSISILSKYVKITDNIANIATIDTGVYATKTDGSLWAWGLHRGGGVGNRLAVISNESHITSPMETTFPIKAALPEDITINPVTEPAGNPFTDVAYGTFYYDAVQWALENHVTTGSSATTFSPETTCTRGQVVTFLWRAVGCPEPTSSVNPFKDVKTSDYFYKAVLWAVEEGITTGVSETRFGPSEICSGANLITFLWRAVDEPTSDVSALPERWQTAYFGTALAWAREHGLTAPSNTDYNIGCARAHIVTYLYKVLA